ncbi:MAG TPA: Ku protein [Candidatus Norongarragalinales archaeon]|jgi:DNA end-binding protein Ku|nr:Ku protein [Candidatus Norongarragalinales archaeon]
MKSIWEGELVFGLINMPVRLYTAVEAKDVAFRLLHEKCRTPLRYERYCPFHKQEVPWPQVVKGYEYEKGKFVIVKPTDFAKIPLRSVKAIDVEQVALVKDIDPIFFEKSYYIAPQEKGKEAYALLREALKHDQSALVCKFVQRNKEHLAIIRVHDNVLVLTTLYYWDEIRSTEHISELETRKQPSKQQLEAALELLRNSRTTFSLARYRDEYRDWLQKIILAKIKGKELELPPSTEELRKTKNLMEALRASIDIAKRKNRPRK